MFWPLLVMQGMLVERQPLHALRLVFDAVNMAFADYLRLHPSPSQSTPTSQHRAIPAVTPQVHPMTQSSLLLVDARSGTYSLTCVAVSQHSAGMPQVCGLPGYEGARV